MTNQINKISIDLNLFDSQLRGEISSDLKTLQLVDEAVTKDNYSTNTYTLINGGLASEVTVPPIEYLKQREINKCFKSVIGSLQDYLDKLLAVLRLVEEEIIPPQSSTMQDIAILLQSKFTELVLEVSSDRSLNIPKKLSLLLTNPKNQEIKNSVLSFFQVRNGLEHHKGIANSQRTVSYTRLALASSAGYEVTPPVILGPGEGLVLKSFSEKIEYDKGGNLNLTRSQLDGIILNLLLFVIPTMKNEVEAKINGPR
jgi:hypothetical protein